MQCDTLMMRDGEIIQASMPWPPERVYLLVNDGHGRQHVGALLTLNADLIESCALRLDKKRYVKPV